SSVSAGYTFSCAVKIGGSVVCWPKTPYGVPSGVTVLTLSAGANDTCGILPGQAVSCWGDNSSGQSRMQQEAFQSVSAGGYHTCGVKPDGTAACWGSTGAAPTGTFSS